MIKQAKGLDYLDDSSNEKLLDEKLPCYDDMNIHASYDIKRTQALPA